MALKSRSYILDLVRVKLSLGNFFFLSCLMEIFFHQILGSTNIFVKNTHQKAAILMFVLILPGLLTPAWFFGGQYKLDGVGPVDNRPSTDKLHHFIWRKKIKLHVTCDMWQVTHDTWHVTCDTWHVTRLGGWTFSQNFSTLALTVCDLWYYEDLEEKDESLN